MEQVFLNLQAYPEISLSTILHLLILSKQSQPTVDQVFKHMSHWIHLHSNYRTPHSSNIYAPEPVGTPSQDSHYYSS